MTNIKMDFTKKKKNRKNKKENAIKNYATILGNENEIITTRSDISFSLNIESLIKELLLDNNVVSYMYAGKLLFIVLSSLSLKVLGLERLLMLLEFFFYKGGKNMRFHQIHLNLLLFLYNYSIKNRLLVSKYVFNHLIDSNDLKALETHKDRYMLKNTLYNTDNLLKLHLKDFIITLRNFFIKEYKKKGVPNSQIENGIYKGKIVLWKQTKEEDHINVLKLLSHKFNNNLKKDLKSVLVKHILAKQQMHSVYLDLFLLYHFDNIHVIKYLLNQMMRYDKSYFLNEIQLKIDLLELYRRGIPQVLCVLHWLQEVEEDLVHNDKVKIENSELNAHDLHEVSEELGSNFDEKLEIESDWSTSSDEILKLGIDENANVLKVLIQWEHEISDLYKHEEWLDTKEIEFDPYKESCEEENVEFDEMKKEIGIVEYVESIYNSESNSVAENYDVSENEADVEIGTRIIEREFKADQFLNNYMKEFNKYTDDVDKYLPAIDEVQQQAKALKSFLNKKQQNDLIKNEVLEDIEKKINLIDVPNIEKNRSKILDPNKNDRSSIYDCKESYDIYGCIDASKMIRILLNNAKSVLEKTGYNRIYVKLFYSYLIPVLSFEHQIDLFLLYSLSEYKVMKPLLFIIFYNSYDVSYILKVFNKIQGSSEVYANYKKRYFDKEYVRDIPKAYFIFLFLLSPFFFDTCKNACSYLFHLCLCYDKAIICDEEKDINYERIYENVIIKNDEHLIKEKKYMNIIIIKFIQLFQKKFDVYLCNYFDFYRIFFILLVSCVNVEVE